MGQYDRARLGVLAWVVMCGWWISAAAQTPDVDALIAQVGERVAAYYRQAQHVICIERSTVQPIQSNWSDAGFARIVESELRIESEASDGQTFPEVALVRDIRRVNGRAPRERDKTDRSGCTDPNPLSPEPLAFLLPPLRDEYRFSSIRDGREGSRAALIVDFTSRNQASRPELIEDERGHDDCFDWTGPLATRGRVWVDAVTHDVLRVDRHVRGIVDIRVPWALQRRYSLPSSVVLEREDETIRYKVVKFSDPEEALLLPASIATLSVLRNSLQSTRRTRIFDGCRRFLTDGRVKDR
jgi:hypothetical protein